MKQVWLVFHETSLHAVCGSEYRARVEVMDILRDLGHPDPSWDRVRLVHKWTFGPHLISLHRKDVLE